MKKIVKSDITFLIALAFFAVASFSRFFDEKIKKHTALFEFMKDYEYAIGFTVVYFVVLFIFFAVCIANCERENKKDIYYLICFYSVFAFPMFLAARYFGTMDIYAWILTWIAGILLIKGKMEWLIIIISFIISVVSPMALVSSACVLIAIILYKFFAQKEKKYLWCAIASLLTSLVGVFVSNYLGTFATDEQHVLEMNKFVMMILFLSPYLYIAATFFYGLIRRTRTSKKWGYYVLVLGIVPSTVVYTYLEDYARVIFHVFSYFILNVIMHIVLNDKDVVWQLQKTKDMIKKWVPIPVLVIAIPFLFMTLWISGEQHLMKEVFINK